MLQNLHTVLQSLLMKHPNLHMVLLNLHVVHQSLHTVLLSLLMKHPNPLIMLQGRPMLETSHLTKHQNHHMKPPSHPMVLLNQSLLTKAQNPSISLSSHYVMIRSHLADLASRDINQGQHTELLNLHTNLRLPLLSSPQITSQLPLEINHQIISNPHMEMAINHQLNKSHPMEMPM